MGLITESPWYPLDTPRLILRPYTPDDLDEIHAYAKDSETTRFLPWGPNAREATREFLDSKLEQQTHWPREDCTLAITLKSNARLIGGVRLSVHDAANRTADLGYVLHPDYWGRGYMTEAAGALLAVAFSVLHLHRVWAACDVRNTGSWRVMEKVGMRREATHIRDVLQKGEWRDSYHYAILEDEWKGTESN